MCLWNQPYCVVQVGKQSVTELTSLHRGASAGGWEMGTSRAGMVKSTIVNPPFLLPVIDWCLAHIGMCVCVEGGGENVQIAKQTSVSVNQC